MGKKKKKKDQKKKSEDSIEEIVKAESDEEKIRLRKSISSHPSNQYNQFEKGSGFENEVQELWQEAQEMGYKTLRDYLAHLYRSWDEEQEILVISQLYNSYLLAIQTGAESRFDGKVWSVKNTFKDWLFYSKKNIQRRLSELRLDYENKRISFEGMSSILPDMDDVPGRVGESLRPEERDFYVLVMKKTKETIEKAIKDSAWVDKCLKKADDLMAMT